MSGEDPQAIAHVAFFELNKLSKELHFFYMCNLYDLIMKPVNISGFVDISLLWTIHRLVKISLINRRIICCWLEFDTGSIVVHVRNSRA